MSLSPHTLEKVYASKKLESKSITLFWLWFVAISTICKKCGYLITTKDDICIKLCIFSSQTGLNFNTIQPILVITLLDIYVSVNIENWGFVKIPCDFWKSLFEKGFLIIPETIREFKIIQKARYCSIDFWRN